MPKSRGRKGHRPARRSGPAASWQAVVLRAARSLTSPDTPRVLAESFASGLAGKVWVGRGLGDREILDAWLDELLPYAERRRADGGAVAVAALSLVVSHQGLDDAMRDWARELTTELPWCQEPVPLPVRAWRSADVWDDAVAWFLEYDDCVLSVRTARSDQGAITGAGVHDHGILEQWDDMAGQSDGAVRRRTAAPVEEVVATLLDAQWLTELTYPPNEDQGYVETGHLIAARLAAVGVSRPVRDAQPLPDAERELLVEAFLASRTPTLDDEVVREVVDLCLTYGEGYLGDDPLAWSPMSVETFLLDWVPRKTVLEPEVRQLAPRVTQEFTRWAMQRRGVPTRWAKEGSDVAREAADDFAEICDGTVEGPAQELVRRLMAKGIDLHDQVAVDAEISAYNAHQLALRASGR